jgi:hypothetical protein
MRATAESEVEQTFGVELIIYDTVEDLGEEVEKKKHSHKTTFSGFVKVIRNT